jgi:4-hydroxy-2-oxoheptanedioate aldolase
MIYRNRIKEAIQKTGFALGTFVQIASPENAEIAAASGFDFIILDMEHGSFGIDSLVNMIRGVQLAGASPIVRLPDDSESGIKKTLDAGAVGILVPGVSNPEQAKKIIRAACYGPKGNRGACPRVRATAHGIHPWKEHVDWSNENILVWFLIETIEGFKKFDQIVKVPGIDAVAFGAFDLSQDMGYNGQTDHPEVKKEFERAFALAKDNHVDVNMHLFEASAPTIQESAKRWASLGARILTCMTDRRVLSLGFKEAFSGLASLRGGKG